MDVQRFLENFATIAEAPGGVQRLRSLVLDLAISGRLTDAMPGESPETLSFMSQAPSRGEHESNYPSRWPVFRLADVAEVRLGRQRSPSKETGDRMRPYLRAANVGWNGLRLDDVKEMAFTEGESEAYELRVGDLLLAEASGSATEVGKPAQYRGEIPECCFQNTLIRVRLRDGLRPDFYELYFKQQARSGRFASSSRGVGINHLGARTLAEWSVPFPPVAEQERIVATVDELTRLCDELDAHKQRRNRATRWFRGSALHALTRAESPDDLARAWERVSTNWAAVANHADALSALRSTTLQLAVEGRLVPGLPDEGTAEDAIRDLQGERDELANSGLIDRPRPRQLINASDVPFPLPHDWSWVRVEDVVTHVVDCLHRTPTYTARGYPAIRTCDLEPGRLLLDQALRVDEATFGEQTRRLLPEPGDVLYSREGGRYGIAAVVPLDAQLCLSQRMMLFRCGRAVVPDYFSWFLNSPLGFGQAAEDVGGSASPHVNIRSIRRFLMPLPPTGQQHRIVYALGQIFDQIDALGAAIDRRELIGSQLGAAIASDGLN